MAYFPDDQEYKDYLKKNPVSREVSVAVGPYTRTNASKKLPRNRPAII
jgi:hypothetical protein